MNYIKLFEEFEPKEIVTIKGEVAKVVSDRGEKVAVQFFKPNRIELVDKEDVKSQVKCLSQCDKRVVGEGDDRYIKCFYCGKEQRFR